MNTQNEPQPMPLARLLYSPARASNLQENPSECLPGETLINSYVRQWYRFTLGGTHYALRPASAVVNPYNTYWPDPLAVDDEVRQQLQGYVLGYSHPDGVPSDADSLADQRALLERVVRQQTLDVVPMAILHRESQWVEPAVLVRGVTQDQAREIARTLGQRAFVEVNTTSTRAMLVDGYFPLGGYEWNLHKLPLAPCPLSLGYEVNVRPQREGGPWVSRSREIAALWQHHHAFTHAHIACDVCSRPGKTGSKGAAIPLGSVIPASRYKYSYVSGFGDDAVHGLTWNTPLMDEPAGGI